MSKSKKKTKKPDKQYVVMVGDAIDGHSLYGPFDDANTAGDWASVEFSDKTWWTVSIDPPPNFNAEDGSEFKDGGDSE